ncbi:MAG: twin-arginine translocation signal domain-containing protein, partial [Akkermansiaceae bacterium]
MTENERYLQALTRRHFLTRCGVGLGGAALANMMGNLAQAEEPRVHNPLAPRMGTLPAKAKNIIYLHMAGSP